MNAINWMMSKSEVVSHEADASKGWPANTEYFFNGTLPSRMTAEVIKHAQENNAQYRDTNKEVAYNWIEGETSYSVIFGAYKSTKNTVRFSAQEIN